MINVLATCFILCPIYCPRKLFVIREGVNRFSHIIFISYKRIKHFVKIVIYGVIYQWLEKVHRNKVRLRAPPILCFWHIWKVAYLRDWRSLAYSNNQTTCTTDNWFIRNPVARLLMLPGNSTPHKNDPTHISIQILKVRRCWIIYDLKQLSLPLVRDNSHNWIAFKMLYIVTSDPPRLRSSDKYIIGTCFVCRRMPSIWCVEYVD